MSKSTVFEFTVLDAKGRNYDLSQHKGKTVLIVNTASKCGFTPQYAGLEVLHKTYAAEGLVVLGFPCDQFAHQEPGNNEEIASFCSVNYGVTFPILAKIDVNGKAANPLFEFLRKKTGNLLGDAVAWNFTKFLIAPDGKTIKRFAPTTSPESMVDAIKKLLAHK